MAYSLKQPLYKIGDQVLVTTIGIVEYPTRIMSTRYSISDNQWTYFISHPIHDWLTVKCIKLNHEPCINSYSNLMNLVRNNVKVIELPSGDLKWTTI